MEVLKEFLLFGVVEIFIILLFIKTIGKMENIKYWHLFVICPVYCICGYINLPYVKQLSVFLILIAYISVLSKNVVSGIKYSILSILYLLCIESIIGAILGIPNIIDMSKINDDAMKFILFIPIRLLEIYILFLMRKRC